MSEPLDLVNQLDKLTFLVKIPNGKTHSAPCPRACKGTYRQGEGSHDGPRGDWRSALGFTECQAIDVVMSLTPADFYKSMTTYADHMIWQDVYRPYTVCGQVYLKLTVIDDVLIVSFKELQA